MEICQKIQKKVKIKCECLAFTVCKVFKRLWKKYLSFSDLVTKQDTQWMSCNWFILFMEHLHHSLKLIISAPIFYFRSHDQRIKEHSNNKQTVGIAWRDINK